MSRSAKNKSINGYEVAVYENSRGVTHYLYQGNHPTHGKIFVWFEDRPNGKLTSYGVDYYPCPMPSGFEVAETANIQHPVLKKM